ncbi:MAG: ATP-binding cassette domain-containing protein [Polyangiaceae bacterium]
MIRVEGLRKTFDHVVAVDAVSFEALDGEITGFLGPNGAGKSTTMRMVTTLVQPDAGHVYIDGIDAMGDPMRALRRLGVLPDARGISPRLTPREQIRYYGQLHGLEGAELEQRIDDLVDLLDLRAIADRRAQGFSQGERMKVAIGRALVHRPQNVLLDEPTNGLDVMATRALRELLKRLRSQGICVLLSSHVMQEIAALCDRVVVIAHGRVVASGTPVQLREQTGCNSLEDAFVELIGTTEGLAQ